jgi:hypothetical protein
MDHKHIDEFDLVDRYLMGRLAAEETARFEEHFVDCVECVNRLSLTKTFIEELRRVGIDLTREASVLTTQKAIGRRWYYHRKALAWMAASIFVIALAGALLLSRQVRNARTDAEIARNASAEWERRFEEQRQTSASAEIEYQETQRKLFDRVSQLEAQQNDLKKEGADGGAEINVPVLTPTSTRASDPGAISEIKIPRSSRSFYLSLPLEGETGYRSYRMTILDSGHQQVSESPGLKPSGNNSISVIFRSKLFPAGVYTLTLEGVGADRRITVVGKYFFRVVKP